MIRFRSLLIDRAKIRIPGLTVRTLAVHRHLQEHASVAPHAHPWNQVLLYLSGQGVQWLGTERLKVAGGSLVLVPAGLPHAFERTSARVPLCLMIDFVFAAGRSQAGGAYRIGAEELAGVRQTLATLIGLDRDGGAEALSVQGAPLVLQMLTGFLRRAGWFGNPSRGSRGGNVVRLHSLLQRMDVAAPLRDTIARSGYQRDHLNRVLRRETGLSLGQHRARQRLARAQALLGQGLAVAAVADAVGLADPSYFARWFRRQTGISPIAWSARAGAPGHGPRPPGGAAKGIQRVRSPRSGGGKPAGR
jgi:AraC family L-rhamnose operon transcriptional activator RhaR